MERKQLLSSLGHSIAAILFGQVKGRRPPGCPRSSFNDVAVRDCQLRRITKPYKDAQNRCFGGTRLALRVPSSS